MRSRALSVACALIMVPVLNRVLTSVLSRPLVKISPLFINAPTVVRLVCAAMISAVFSKLFESVLNLPPASICPLLVTSPAVVKVKSRPA
ncbi:Uncharacterised protein [Yersinia frederiksenii]|nr:Uncharacterised protein [Yersinia frederiksenii]